jgi:hypothetical protein
MAFKASDYPEIRNASEAYDVARAEFQKLNQQLSDTATTSPRYKDLVARRNEAKTKSEAALKKYEGLVAKRKKEYDDEQKKKQNRKKSDALKAKLETLKNDRQRAEDRGDSTSVIDAAIQKAQDDLNKLKVKKTEEEKKAPGRPDGVPASAKFSSVTGQWTLGNKKWDKNGKSITTGSQGSKTDGSKVAADSEVNQPGITKTDGNFDPGSFRMAEEKDRATATTATGPTAVETDFAKVLAQAQSTFGGIDELFSTNDELRKLLIKAVGDPNKVGDEYTTERFVSELENTNWFKSNAGPIRQRGFYERQYKALEDKLKKDDPKYKEKLAELRRTSEWGRGLQDTIETVNEYVTQLLGIGAVDDATVQTIAEDIYRYANEDDAVKIRNAVLGAAKYGGATPMGGQAAETLASLKSIAGANGFDLEAQFKTELPTWLDRIAKGESPEVYKKIIRDAAKAAYGVSDRVAALMDQGVDLDTIYSPYKNVMSSVLEINPSTVTLKDLSEKGVFGAKQEMNLYDFQKQLRKDARWQYTQNARQEVSDSVLGVLRDFGFQG